ncbi:MAG: 4-hydroxy-tetrahydrodipicolinate reductase [Bacteroidales bacterium]|nr:4-hydroxy-tetrahydrodipicolinate reductase [Bacteroidales bacterium]
MKYILMGYGKMGKTIEKTLKTDGNQLIATIDNHDELTEKEDYLDNADVAFEFSTPESAYDNILACFKHNLPVVCGTTGWTDRLPEIETICKNEGKTLMYAPNYSIGINIFIALNNQIADIISNLDMYSISMSETHHVHKKDAPSGTALQIKNQILQHLSNSSMKDTDIPILSIREGEVTGIHEVKYTSDLDTIELKHTAKTRDAFAYGAILAAKWIKDKKGCFKMQDIIKSLYLCEF